MSLRNMWPLRFFVLSMLVDYASTLWVFSYGAKEQNPLVPHNPVLMGVFALVITWFLIRYYVGRVRKNPESKLRLLKLAYVIGALIHYVVAYSNLNYGIDVMIKGV